MKLGAQLATLTVGTLAAVGIVYLPGDDPAPAPEQFVTTAAILDAVTTTTVWTPDPIAPALDADQHDTETITAAVPAIPDGLGYQAPTTTTTLVPESALCGMWWVTATVAATDSMLNKDGKIWAQIDLADVTGTVRSRTATPCSPRCCR